ncbi:MAG: cbb3-type cytochrome oxidase assembly protein CcoS [Burkholderiales bacterium]|nr:cbb3-type cytochrome oxidase assembly protein CcoS [Burkholderiales bacterium]
MDILFLLIPLSVVLVFLIGAVFWLALRGGQFDDLESPGLDVVLDDDKPPPLPARSDAEYGAHEAGRKPPGIRP